MIYIGIDPGKDGSICAIKPDLKLELFKMPKIGKIVDLHELHLILFGLTRENHFVCLEDVSPVRGASAHNCFAFGENKGHIEGLLVGMGASYQKVAPKAWQKVCWEGVPLMKKPCKGGEKNDTKAMSLVAAKRLFPGESFLASARSSVPHDGLVDAALIAKYGQIKYGK